MTDRNCSFTEEEIRKIGNQICVCNESIDFCIELVAQGLISHDRSKLEKFLRDAHDISQRKLFYLIILLFV